MASSWGGLTAAGVSPCAWVNGLGTVGITHLTLPIRLGERLTDSTEPGDTTPVIASVPMCAPMSVNSVTEGSDGGRIGRGGGDSLPPILSPKSGEKDGVAQLIKMKITERIGHAPTAVSELM